MYLFLSVPITIQIIKHPLQELSTNKQTDIRMILMNEFIVNYKYLVVYIKMFVSSHLHVRVDSPPPGWGVVQFGAEPTRRLSIGLQDLEQVGDIRSRQAEGFDLLKRIVFRSCGCRSPSSE